MFETVRFLPDAVMTGTNEGGFAKTFTANGVVDEEAQRNDLAIVREIAGVTEVVPIQRAYDFSFARQADQQLTKAGWKP